MSTAHAAKKACPVTKSEFMDAAKPMDVVINGIPMTAEAKQFTTGSVGWYLSGKVSVRIGDKVVPVQVGLNLTVVGSKEAAE